MPAAAGNTKYRSAVIKKENHRLLTMKEKVFAILLLLLGFGLTTLPAQGPVETEEDYDKKYQQRIQQEYLYGVYIPKDLSDAIVQLNKLAERESLQKFRAAQEDTAVQKLHFSLGRWIIYNWGFYDGSRLAHKLKQMGLHHPDDMAKFIIRSFHRSLNKKPIEVKAQLKALQEARAKTRLQRLQEGEVLYQEKRQLPPDSTEKQD